MLSSIRRRKIYMSTCARVGEALDSARLGSSTVRAVNRLRGCFSTNFRVLSDHKAVEHIDSVHNDLVHLWFCFLAAFDLFFKFREGRGSVITDILSCLLRAATEYDRSGPNRLTQADKDDTYLFRARGLRTRSSPISGVGFGWESRLNRIWRDSSVVFIHCFVATSNRCLWRAVSSTTADTVILCVSPCPL